MVRWKIARVEFIGDDEMVACWSLDLGRIKRVICEWKWRGNFCFRMIGVVLLIAKWKLLPKIFMSSWFGLLTRGMKWHVVHQRMAGIYRSMEMMIESEKSKFPEFIGWLLTTIYKKSKPFNIIILY